MTKEKPKTKYSVQLVFIGIFSVSVAVSILLLCVFPTTSARDLMFSEKRSALLNQAGVVSSSLSALEKLSSEGVTQVMSLIGLGDYDRVVVTDQGGDVLYDTRPSAENSYGELASDLVDRALTGNAVFSCQYTGDAFRSRAAAPVMSYGSVIGSVYLYERDLTQAAFIQSLQARMRTVGIALGCLTLAVTVFFTRALTRRMRELVRGMRIVREGDYDYRVTPHGRDEVTELSEEFNDMTDRLQQTEELRRRFVSDASHELRTPLSSIILLSDSVLQSENMDEATMREFVSDIGTEAERLQRMTEKLLRLTRMDSHVPTECSCVDLKQVTERAVHLLEPLAGEKDVTVYTDLAEGCVVMGSADDMYQIVFNLAENAVKYNSFGGNVFLRLTAEDTDAVLTVEDTGIGIPEEDIPHIFDRFYRVDKNRSRATGGSGLGLSIVHNAVEQNGGSISVERRETVGTRFTLRFALRTEAAAEREAAP